MEKKIKNIIKGAAYVVLGSFSLSLVGGFSIINLSIFTGDQINVSNQSDSYNNANTITNTGNKAVSEADASNELKEILGTKLNGSFQAENQILSYKYTAPVSGKYRFDFDINDVNYGYTFTIKDKKNEELGQGSYNDEGISVELTGGESYTIVLEQESGLPEFEIAIGVPNPKQIISSSTFNGSIRYTDQIDYYEYTAPISGKYRFDFKINDVNCRYRFNLYDHKKEELNRSYSSDKGATVDLTANEKYSIAISQADKTADYSINIGVPLQIGTVTSNNINGSITYIDQENKYTYTPNKSGKYVFEMKNDNVENTYILKVYSSIKEELGKSNSYYKQSTVNLEAGEEYTICVQEDNGLCNYNINIYMEE